MSNPRRARWAALAVTALVGLGFTGCAGRPELPTAPQRSDLAPQAEPNSVISASDCSPATVFDASNFTHSTVVNNQWYPLFPGTQYILEGRADRGGGVLPHRVVLVVTDLVKVIDGVPCVVLWDRDFQENELVEAELAFHTQDNDGNVWNLGEYPEEYDGGAFTGAPNTWISGLADAEGGIIVQGDPTLGNKFLQGYVPSIDFLDCAKVFKTGESTCVPTGCYSNVLVISERSPLEPGSGKQLKYYAPGVGNVQIGAVGDKEKETLVLVEKRMLDATELSVAREEALRLDTHAYEVSEIYRMTSPAH